MNELDVDSGHARDLHLPPMYSPRIRLRIVHPQDYPFLYELSLEPELGFRWRFRNDQPTFEEFVRGLGATVFSQYLIVHTVSNERLGLVVCYQANRANRNAYLGVQGTPTSQSRGYLIEATELFIDHLFNCFGFEKLYAECPEFNLPRFKSGVGTIFEPEGVLKRHEYFLGQWWDLHLLAVYKSMWQSRYAERQSRVAEILSAHSVDHSNLDLERFCEYLRIGMDLGEVAVEGKSRIVADLEFDSLQMYELLSLVEDLGIAMRDNVLGEVETIEDLHFQYLQGSPLP